MAKWHEKTVKEALGPFKDAYYPATQCGITKIYKNRVDATGDVISTIEGAKSRVWLLGIAIGDCIRLEAPLATTLEAKEMLFREDNKGRRERGDERGVRILLQDPYSNSAIFRTLLEVGPRFAAEILRFNLGVANDTCAPGVDNPLWGAGIFDRITQAIHMLGAHYSLRHVVRFCGQNQNCWLVIVDDTAYFESYTFGRGDVPEGHCIGRNMPVFKVRMQFDTDLFRVLEDHFRRLWATSTVGALQMSAKELDRDNLVKKIFNDRGWWLTRVYQVFHGRRDKPESADERRYPRRRCEYPMTRVTMFWGPSAEVGVEISDYSEDGIGVKVDRRYQQPSTGEEVRIDFGPDAGREPPAQFIVNHYRRTSRNGTREPLRARFTVAGVQPPSDDGFCIVRLKIPEQKPTERSAA